MKNIDVVRKMGAEELARLLDGSSCERCVYQGDCVNKDCEKGIQEWLEKECDMTPKDVRIEMESYCTSYQGYCTDCEYSCNANGGDCEVNYLVANFNVINGKITRKEI